MRYPDLLSVLGDNKHCKGHWLFFGVNCFIMVTLTSALLKDARDNKESEIVACLPTSQKLLLTCYFNKHDVLVDSQYEKFLGQNFQLISSHEEVISKGGVYTPKLSISNRDLDGEGSHRQLVTSLVVDIESASYRHDFKSCKAIVVEKLPSGIFADAFELQRLAQRGVFSDVAVFGDKNLELPSALSNRSIVEIHMDIEQQTLSDSSRWLKLTIFLPLHARYPPLDLDSYWNVKLEEPDLLISCIPVTSSSDDGSTLLVRYYYNNATDLVWKIPCGNGEHTTMVSAVTFASALISALLLVYSTVYSSKQHIKVA